MMHSCLSDSEEVSDGLINDGPLTNTVIQNFLCSAVKESAELIAGLLECHLCRFMIIVH